MKKMRYTIMIIGLSVFAYTFNAIVLEKRSLQSKLVQDILSLELYKPDTRSTDTKIVSYLDNKRAPYVWPDSLKIENTATVSTQDNRNVYILNESGSSPKKILYIHGGAYMDELIDQHITMLDKIASKTDATIYIPDYLLTPENDFKTSYPMVLNLYQSLLSTTDPSHIIIMGDSAGGGYTLGLSLLLKEKNIVQPSQLILLSPWLDVTLSNPNITDQLKKNDKLLGKNIESLKILGKYWAGEESTTHPIVSPIYGDLKELPPITTFVGSYEIFLPDINDLHNILNNNNQKNKLIIYDKMQHVFPAFPIPEGSEAINEIVDLINIIFL